MGKFLMKYGFVEDEDMSDQVMARMSWMPTADEMAGITDIRPREAAGGVV